MAGEAGYRVRKEILLNCVSWGLFDGLLGSKRSAARIEGALRQKYPDISEQELRLGMRVYEDNYGQGFNKLFKYYPLVQLAWKRGGSSIVVREALKQVPPEERNNALLALSLYGRYVKPRKRSVLEGVWENFVRGVETLPTAFADLIPGKATWNIGTKEPFSEEWRRAIFKHGERYLRERLDRAFLTKAQAAVPGGIPVEGGFWGQALGQAAYMLPSILGSAAAAVLTKHPGQIGYWAAIIAHDRKLDLVRRGLDPEEAERIALASAVPEALVEIVQVRRFIPKRLHGAFVRRLANVLQGYVREVGEEGLQQAIFDATTAVAAELTGKKVPMSFKQAVKDCIENMRQATGSLAILYGPGAMTGLVLPQPVEATEQPQPVEATKVAQPEAQPEAQPGAAEAQPGAAKAVKQPKAAQLEEHATRVMDLQRQLAHAPTPEVFYEGREEAFEVAMRRQHLKRIANELKLPRLTAAQIEKADVSDAEKQAMLTVCSPPLSIAEAEAYMRLLGVRFDVDKESLGERYGHVARTIARMLYALNQLDLPIFSSVELDSSEEMEGVIARAPSSTFPLKINPRELWHDPDQIKHTLAHEIGHYLDAMSFRLEAVRGLRMQDAEASILQLAQWLRDIGRRPPTWGVPRNEVLAEVFAALIDDPDNVQRLGLAEKVAIKYLATGHTAAARFAELYRDVRKALTPELAARIARSSKLARALKVPETAEEAYRDVAAFEIVDGLVRDMARLWAASVEKSGTTAVKVPGVDRIRTYVKDMYDVEITENMARRIQTHLRHYAKALKEAAIGPVDSIGGVILWRGKPIAMTPQVVEKMADESEDSLLRARVSVALRSGEVNAMRDAMTFLKRLRGVHPKDFALVAITKYLEANLDSKVGRQKAQQLFEAWLDRYNKALLVKDFKRLAKVARRLPGNLGDKALELVNQFALTKRKQPTIEKARQIVERFEELKEAGGPFAVPEGTWKEIEQALTILEEAGKPLLRDLPLNQLEQVVAGLRSLLAEAQEKLTVQRGNELLELEKVARKAAEHFAQRSSKSVEPSEKRRELPTALRALHSDWLNLRTVLGGIFGRGSPVWEQLNETIRGLGEKIDLQQRAAKPLQEALGELGLRSTGKLGRWLKQTVKLSSLNIEVSKPQAITLLAYLMDHSTHDLIVRGTPLVLSRHAAAPHIVIEPDNVKWVVDELTKHEDITRIWKAMRKGLDVLLDAVKGEYERRRGKAFKTVENYFPRSRSRQLSPQEAERMLTATGFFNLVREVSATKPRAETTKMPLVVESAFEAFFRHVSRVSNYCAMQRRAADLLKLLYHPLVKTTLAARVKGYEDVLGHVRDALRHAAAADMTTELSAVEKLLNWFLRLAHRGFVGLKVFISLYQPISLVNAALMMPKRYILKGLGDVLKGKWRPFEHHPEAGLAAWYHDRVEQGRSRIVTPLLFTKESKRIIEKLGMRASRLDAAYELVRQTDRLAMLAIWQGCHLWAEDTGRNEAWAALKATDVAMTTQPTWDACSLPRLAIHARRKPPLRLLLLFATQPIKNYNVVVERLLDIRYGGFTLRKANKVFKAATVAALLNPALVSALSTARYVVLYRRKWDEKAVWQRFLRFLIMRLAGQVPLGRLVAPIIYNVVAWFRGPHYRRRASGSLLTDMVDAWIDVIETGAKLLRMDWVGKTVKVGPRKGQPAYVPVLIDAAHAASRVAQSFGLPVGDLTPVILRLTLPQPDWNAYRLRVLLGRACRALPRRREQRADVSRKALEAVVNLKKQGYTLRGAAKEAWKLYRSKARVRWLIYWWRRAHGSDSGRESTAHRLGA